MGKDEQTALFYARSALLAERFFTGKFTIFPMTLEMANSSP
jgi:hypothetical protein